MLLLLLKALLLLLLLKGHCCLLGLRREKHADPRALSRDGNAVEHGLKELHNGGGQLLLLLLRTTWLDQIGRRQAILAELLLLLLGLKLALLTTATGVHADHVERVLLDAFRTDHGARWWLLLLLETGGLEEVVAATAHTELI